MGGLVIMGLTFNMIIQTAWLKSDASPGSFNDLAKGIAATALSVGGASVIIGATGFCVVKCLKNKPLLCTFGLITLIISLLLTAASVILILMNFFVTTEHVKDFCADKLEVDSGPIQSFIDLLKEEVDKID